MKLSKTKQNKTIKSELKRDREKINKMRNEIECNQMWLQSSKQPASKAIRFNV